MTTGRINQVTFLSNKRPAALQPKLQPHSSLASITLCLEGTAWTRLTRSQKRFNPWFFQFSTGCRERKKDNLQTNECLKRSFFWTSLDRERALRSRNRAETPFRICRTSSWTVESYVYPTGKRTNCNYPRAQRRNVPCPSIFEHCARSPRKFALSTSNTSTAFVLNRKAKFVLVTQVAVSGFSIEPDLRKLQRSPSRSVRACILKPFPWKRHLSSPSRSVPASFSRAPSSRGLHFELSAFTFLFPTYLTPPG